METINLAIFRYFDGGFTYTEILEFLRVRHGLYYEPLNLKKMAQEERNEKAPARSYTK